MERNKQIKLGLFVFFGTLFLVMALYFIGSKQSLFKDTFKLGARFKNVNGLMTGNNVRFAGIDVGIVDQIIILNDSTVEVWMLIEESSRPFIKNNAEISIGTDGLMGNKLINIKSVTGEARQVNNGDLLNSKSAVDTEEMLRILQKSNLEIYSVTLNLKRLSERINQSNALWQMLSDSTISDNIISALVNIQVTSNNTAILTGDLRKIVNSVKAGNGLVGALLTDSVLSNRLNQTIVKIQLMSDTLALISGDLHSLTSKIKRGEGTLGTLMMDTTFVNNLNQSMINVKNSSKSLDENMEALKSSVFLRRYFKKQAKKKNKTP